MIKVLQEALRRRRTERRETARLLAQHGEDAG